VHTPCCLSSVTCLAVPYLHTLSHKQHEFRRGEKSHNIKYVFVRNIFHSKKNSETYHHKCKQAFTSSNRYSCQILFKLRLSGQNSKNPQISNFMKIRSAGAGLFPADGQTDIRKLIVAVRNFAKAPKNDIHTGTSTPTTTTIIIIRIIIIALELWQDRAMQTCKRQAIFSVVLHKKSLSFSRLQCFKGFKTKILKTCGLPPSSSRTTRPSTAHADLLPRPDAPPDLLLHMQTSRLNRSRCHAVRLL
jgi:hypothetical protein